MTTKQWKVDKTVSIGDPKLQTADDFFTAIAAKHLQIGLYVEGYIKAMIATLGKSQREIKLARVTVSDLGFTDGTQTETFLEAVIQAGLVAVPPETGVYYKLQFGQEPYDERFHMFAPPIVVEKYGPARLFIVNNSISADCGGGAIGLAPDCVWVCGIPE